MIRNVYVSKDFHKQLVKQDEEIFIIFSMKALSLVIPTLNEEANIASLVKRIHETLSKHDIVYEIIFIDDHSHDKTREIIKKFAADYPIKLAIKKR